MAVKFLVEGATNLSQSGSWSPSGVPEGGDDVILRDGTQVVNAGLDALAALTLASFTVEPTWGGTLGTPGAGVELTTVTGEIAVFGGINVHLAPSGTVPLLRIQKESNGVVRLITGTYTLVTVWLGSYVFEDAAIVTALKASASSGELLGRNNAVGTVKLGAGAVVQTMKNIGTSALLAGGSTLTTLRDNQSGATVAAVEIAGGRMNHKSGGTITMLEGVSGTFSDRGGIDYVVTNQDRYAGFRIDRGPGITVTETNPPVYVGPDEQSFAL